MSRGNWLQKLAVGGLLAAFLWAGHALAQEAQKVDLPALESQPKSESAQGASKSGGAESSQDKQPTAEKLTPALDKIESAIRDLIAQQNAAQGQGPKDNEISDLEAQEGMAYWAKLMFWTSLAMVAITGVGIYLIKRTLGETRRAAIAAEGMLKEAKKTTAAAEAAVDETRKTATRQLRAYLGVSDAYVKYIDPTHIQANITISNSGQTPANEVTRVIEADLRNPKRPGEFSLGERHRGRQPIAPDAFWVIRKDQAISEQDLQELIKSTAESARELFVWGAIKYFDIYKKPHTLSFRYRTHARRWEVEPEKDIRAIRGWDLHPEEDGNEST